MCVSGSPLPPSYSVGSILIRAVIHRSWVTPLIVTGFIITTLSDQMYASAFSSVIEMTFLETEQQLNYELYVVYLVIYYCLI